MTKSLYVIGGLGLGACLVLSMMMQHLLEVKNERDRPAVVIEVEQILGGRLVGPATLVQKDREGRTLEMRLKVLAGLDKEKLARTAGNLVWLRRGSSDALQQLTVVVQDEDGSEERFEIDCPFRSRTPTPPARSTTTGDPGKAGGDSTPGGADDSRKDPAGNPVPPRGSK